jgi:hypothetical protein
MGRSHKTCPSPRCSCTKSSPTATTRSRPSTAPTATGARFFAAGEGYLGTELLWADGRYLLIDRWSTRAAYEAFLAAHADEYARRNEAAKRLWADERDLGRFESA